MASFLDYNAHIFCFMLLAGIIALDTLHFPFWPNFLIPPWSHPLEEFYVKTYNDPLSGGYSIPNGWQSGMYFFEQLYTPFLFYQWFGKNGIVKELGGIVVGTGVSLMVSLCLFEVLAFDETVVSMEQKMALMPFYISYFIPALIWAFGSIYRVYTRVLTAEKQLKEVKKQ